VGLTAVPIPADAAPSAVGATDAAPSPLLGARPRRAPLAFFLGLAVSPSPSASTIPPPPFDVVSSPAIEVVSAGIDIMEVVDVKVGEDDAGAMADDTTLEAAISAAMTAKSPRKIGDKTQSSFQHLEVESYHIEYIQRV